MLETLSIVGTIILIIIGIFIITLLAYALRLLLLIYSFFSIKDTIKKGMTDTKIDTEEGGKGKFSKFITSASVVEIILFLLRSRGRFRR